MSIIFLFLLSIYFSDASQLVKDFDKTAKLVSNLQDDVRILKDSIKIETDAISGLESHIRYNEARISAGNKLIRERLKALLKYSSNDRLALFNENKNSDDFYIEESIIAKLLKDDIRKYRKLIIEIGNLNDLRVLLDSERVKLQTSSQKLSKQLAELEESIKDKKTLLTKIKSSDNDYTILQNDMEKSSSTLANIADAEKEITKNNRFVFTKLFSPLKGRIIVKFGNVWDNKLKNWKKNDGVVVEASYGTEVFCIEDGIVKYSGWVLGFGKVIIIKHSNGAFSIYGHLARILFDVGEQVKKRDALAYVGDTGNVEVPSLYFSLRFAGKSIDPSQLFN